MSSTVATRLAALRSRIHGLERRYGRAEGSVRLLAVSKTKSAEAVREAFEAGQRDFGENQLQDALGKLDLLSELPLGWHFIGHVQSNKTRDIARHFQWVHTVDRLKIAVRLDAAAERPINVCIQVNVDAEPQKAGVDPADLPDLVARVAELPRLRLRGLMAIPAPGDTRSSFHRTRALFEKLAAQAGEDWDTLSMGMSDDFADAIAEGANLVRIGTAIFGPRPRGG